MNSFSRAPHILHVEDDPYVQQIVRDSLTKDGFIVITSGSVKGAEEYDSLHPGEIDLFIVDGSVQVVGDGLVYAAKLWQEGKLVVVLSHTYEKGLALYHDKALLGQGELLVPMIRGLFPWLDRLNRALADLAPFLTTSQ